MAGIAKATSATRMTYSFIASCFQPTVKYNYDKGLNTDKGTPVPFQDCPAVKGGQDRHPAQEHAKGQLVIAIDGDGGAPGAPGSVGAAALEVPVKAFEPDGDDRPQAQK